MIDSYVNSKEYQDETGQDSFHHCNFASFKQNTFSEPFKEIDGTMNEGFMPAKYDVNSDQDVPFIYGMPSHHFHRYIKGIWQLIPVDEGSNFSDILGKCLRMKHEIDENRLVRKIARVSNKKPLSATNNPVSSSSQEISSSCSALNDLSSNNK